MGKDGADKVPLDAPEMRQAIAWEFALMAIKRQEAVQAERLLLTSPDTQVRDVQVRSHLLSIHLFPTSEFCRMFLTLEDSSGGQ